MNKSTGSTSIAVFDSTLRDGAQAEGISFSVEDKIKVTRALDELGVAYIEAGNPGSNPKDLEFFQRVKGMKLKNAVLTAFGSTRRPGVSTEEDDNIKNLVMAETPAIAIFGKSWDFHVTEIMTLNISLTDIKTIRSMP
jgi:2-isopropylmalate synthase